MMDYFAPIVQKKARRRSIDDCYRPSKSSNASSPDRPFGWSPCSVLYLRPTTVERKWARQPPSPQARRHSIFVYQQTDTVC